MKKKDKWDWEDDGYGYSGVYRSYGGYGFNRQKKITTINEDNINKENKSDLFGRGLIDKDYTATTHYDVDGRYSHTDYKPTSSGTKKELIPYTQIDPSLKNQTKI